MCKFLDLRPIVVASLERCPRITSTSSTRQARILNEAIADPYGPEERALGWYYYLENQLRFPFEARYSTARVVSPLRKGETVQVLRMASEDACSAECSC
jgi:hypothetical protein